MSKKRTNSMLSAVFVLALVTRLFPLWLHGFFVRLLPQFWIGKLHLRRAKALLAPEFQKRLDSLNRGSYFTEFGQTDSVSGAMLSHLITDARGNERDAEYLAHMQVVLALASIRTVQVHIVNIVFDICAYSELADMVRHEIRQIFRDNDYVWDRHCYNRLKKLDSLTRESQRTNPPSLLSFHRIMYSDYTLSDGTQLPAGAHICMATNAIQNDPTVTPNPVTFDALRYFKIRHDLPSEKHKHQFANASRDALNFGHGKHACPGRFFASLEMKLIVSKLLMEYEFRLPEGKERPVSATAYEFCFPDRHAKVLLRKRRMSGVLPHDEPF